MKTGGWSPFNLLWMSFLGVAIWPTLGIAASHHLFDRFSEAAFLLGGINAIFLFFVALPFGLIFGMANNAINAVFTSTLVVLWLLMWLLPVRWLIRHLRSRRDQAIFMAILSGISLAQAVLGYLMILGKGV